MITWTRSTCARVSVALLCALASGLVFATAPSLALTTHNLQFSFNGADAPGGRFSAVGADAVEQSSGDVYVLDWGVGLIEKFGASGAYAGVQISGASTPATSFSVSYTSGVAVDESGANAGDVYVADTGHGVVDRFSSTGAYQCQITGSATASASECNGASGSPTPAGSMIPTGLAVDSSGDLYVADQASNVVDVFGPAGNYLRQMASPQITSPGTIAMDSSGDLYLTNITSNGVDVVKFDSTGAFSATVDSNAATAVGVDPASGDVYVADAGGISEYDPSGNLIDVFGSSSAVVLGLAVRGSTGDVYADDLNANVADAFGPLVTMPDVSTGDVTGSVTNLTQTSATVTGAVNPDGVAVSSCEFEYVSAVRYSPSSADPYGAGQTVPCTQTDVGSGTSNVGVSANVTGLSESMVYHYRLVAGNTNGTSDSGDQLFVTNGPGFGIASFASTITNQDGSPDTQAGSHPFALTTNITFNQTTDGSGDVVPDGNPKDLRVGLPAGLLGNPTAMPQCPQAVLNQDTCGQGTQVGVLVINQNTGTSTGVTNNGLFPVYNMVPPSGMPAQFGFVVLGVPIRIDFSVRTGGDYGVTSSLKDIPETIPITFESLAVWGVPADPSHDAQRFCQGASTPPCSTDAPLKPLLTMPTLCAGPLTTTLALDSWQDPGDVTTATSTTTDSNGSPVGVDGCNQLDFSPSIRAQPDTTSADSSSGLNFDLSLPESGLLNPNGVAEAELKDAVVTLPAGVSVNPASATGLAACSPAEIGLDNGSDPSCPDASKIGSVVVDTPLLPDPLTGGIFVAQQDDNPFGSLLAIYVTAYADGVWVKLAGHVAADPVTGQLTTTFSNNPQLPFTDFKLAFFGGSHGALATPEACGTYTTTSDLSPWSGGADATSSDSFTIDSGCVSGFSPSFMAGTQNPQAGAYSPLVVSLSRSDVDQELSGLSVTLPPGMVARLAGVQECPDAALAAAAANSGAAELAGPSCPAGSRVGTVETGAGAGPEPYYVAGSAYLTGPYKGAPYGLAVVVPAVAGPYDLGTVVVRQALYIDPTTAQVTAVSDPFPTILQGIPLRIRSVGVTMDRPGFTLAPTSCDPMAVTGTLLSTGGLAAPVSSRFQVGGCEGLGFSPRLSFALSGRGRTRSGDHPTLTATLTQGTGQANIRSARVALPLSLALDTNNSQHVCNYDVAQAVHGGAVGCPANTIVGQATAITPLLSQPLSGPVYLVQGIRFGKQGQRIHTLPSLLIPLRGQIALDLRASSAVNGAQQLVTTFATIPDAPVSKFTLQINGGPKGILVITGRGLNICTKAQVANAQFGAQSGKANSQNDTMTRPCSGVARSKRHVRRRRHPRRR